ncbi:FAD-dependent monooxygenase [Streptomyces sp. WMMC500]|uniref:FAD-dependent monooxygenase n=1 Tax=Streptomyces sp. WMMC500 TaxID=3015154 RepID=UPI00248BBF5C|nr:FAD-dependent monooxygenase [Streptomyces sp. WMMC500]WBB61658.1 FAD-dependent monooxygenase [Streptomyces sp. WMMC500]
MTAPILIAGGGIGGLTAALSLHAAGKDALVIEHARRIDPLGVGIQLLTQGVRELTELGLGDELAELGVATAEYAFCDKSGNRLFSQPRGEATGSRWPQYSIHRGELHLMLLEEVRRRLGSDAVRTGVRLEDFTQHDDRVEVRVTNRESGAVETVEAAALIGADGLNSTVRARLHPDEGPLAWSGQRMWRGVTEGVPPFLTGRSWVGASDGDVTLVAYPIGKGRTNWVCLVRVAEPGPLPDDGPVDDHREGTFKDALHYFEDWSMGWLDVRHLLEYSGTILEYPMVDRDPLPAWGSGRVTLLGDAAHPMYPAGGNGAAQAVLDARVLAYELAQADGDVPAGLAAYERVRVEQANAVVMAARAMERATSPDTWDRAQVTQMMEMYRKKAESEVAQLNSRPSLTPPGRQ